MVYASSQVYNASKWCFLMKWEWNKFVLRQKKIKRNIDLRTVKHALTDSAEKNVYKPNRKPNLRAKTNEMKQIE